MHRVQSRQGSSKVLQFRGKRLSRSPFVVYREFGGSGWSGLSPRRLHEKTVPAGRFEFNLDSPAYYFVLVLSSGFMLLPAVEALFAWCAMI